MGAGGRTCVRSSRKRAKQDDGSRNKRKLRLSSDQRKQRPLKSRQLSQPTARARHRAWPTWDPRKTHEMEPRAQSHANKKRECALRAFPASFASRNSLTPGKTRFNPAHCLIWPTASRKNAEGDLPRARPSRRGASGTPGKFLRMPDLPHKHSSTTYVKKWSMKRT